MGRPYTCPYCGVAGKNVGKGYRQTKTMGLRRIRRCRSCGRKFTPKHQKPFIQSTSMLDQGPVAGPNQENPMPVIPSPAPQTPQPHPEDTATRTSAEPGGIDEPSRKTHQDPDEPNDTEQPQASPDGPEPWDPRSGP